MLPFNRISHWRKKSSPGLSEYQNINVFLISESWQPVRFYSHVIRFTHTESDIVIHKDYSTFRGISLLFVSTPSTLKVRRRSDVLHSFVYLCHIHFSDSWPLTFLSVVSTVHQSYCLYLSRVCDSRTTERTPVRSPWSVFLKRVKWSRKKMIWHQVRLSNLSTHTFILFLYN